MFISKVRPIAVPQAEHQRLAGALALAWGNAHFERPKVPFESFVLGVGLHDRAYGELDQSPIGVISEEAWQALTWRGFEQEWADPVADLIAKRHLQRLASYSQSPERQAMARAMEDAIQAKMQEHGLDPELFRRIDRITNLCDSAAFDFSFEASTTGSIKIFARNDSSEEVTVSYWVKGGTIWLDPWPLNVERLSGAILGYQLEVYPQTLEPVLLAYQVVPGKPAD
jgi:hypothetical protein